MEMKTEFLKSLGLEDDVIAKIQAESGKDVQKEKDKLQSIQEKLEEQSQIRTDLEAQIKGLKEKQGNTDELQRKISELEQQIYARQEADKKAQEEKVFSERFARVVGDSKFLNEYTEQGIFDEFKKVISESENAGKSDVDIYKTIVSDRDGIFRNDHQPADIPGINPKSEVSSKIGEAEVRKIMGLPIKE